MTVKDTSGTKQNFSVALDAMRVAAGISAMATKQFNASVETLAQSFAYELSVALTPQIEAHNATIQNEEDRIQAILYDQQARDSSGLTVYQLDLKQRFLKKEATLLEEGEYDHDQFGIAFRRSAKGDKIEYRVWHSTRNYLNQEGYGHWNLGKFSGTIDGERLQATFIAFITKMTAAIEEATANGQSPIQGLQKFAEMQIGTSRPMSYGQLVHG